MSGQAPYLTVSLLKAVRFVFGAWYKVSALPQATAFGKLALCDRTKALPDVEIKTGTVGISDIAGLMDRTADLDEENAFVGDLSADGEAVVHQEVTHQ